MAGPAPRAVVCGYGEIATIGLECLEEAGFETVLFVTHPGAPGEAIWWRPPADRARARGVPVVMPSDLDAPEEVERVRAAAPDFLFSFYYRSLIGPAILRLARRGALNLHGSLLPRYRGRAPINWVLVNGESETGVTLHHMDEKADHGDIVVQRPVAIDFADTAPGLFRKVAEAARLVLREALPLLAAGTAPRRPQDHARATLFGRRTPEDGRIAWSWPAIRVYNLVRAVTRPYPGAFTMSGGRRLFVWRAVPADRLRGEEEAPPGTVLGARQGGIAVATGEGCLVVLEAQREGDPAAAGAGPLAAVLAAGERLPS
jgi:methionyl-tRNA formyltransferase